MLVALLIAAALAAGQSAPQPSNSPPSNSAVSNADKAPMPDEIDALQQLYDSSCGSRGYGEYDDVCILITKQLNDAKAAAERAKRVRERAKPPPAQTTGAPKP